MVMPPLEILNQRLRRRQSSGQSREEIIRRVRAARASRIATQTEAQAGPATPSLPAGVTRPSVPAGLVPEPAEPEAQAANPEFGGFLGSGVLENLAGGGLRALGQVQRGIETVGGTGTNIVTSLTPGEQPFERSLDEVQEERGGPAGFFDIAGQAQERAEAFRRTDFPTLDLPGEGIDLIPGGGEFKILDTLGVKGAIELAPDVALAFFTGGGSLVRRATTAPLRALGADTAAATIRGASNVARSAPLGVRRGLTHVIPPNTSAEITARLDEVDWTALRTAMDNSPDALTGPFRFIVDKAGGSTRITGPDEVFGRALLTHMMKEARAEPALAASLANFQNKFGVTRTSRLGNVTRHAPFEIAEDGLMTVLEGGETKQLFWGNVFESAFTDAGRNTRRFTNLSDEQYDFIRNYQDYTQEVGDLMRQRGIKVTETILEGEGGRYIRRIVRDVEGVTGSRGRTAGAIGATPSSLKKRSLFGDAVEDGINNRGINYETDPFAVLEEFQRTSFRAVRDHELGQDIRKAARDPNAGIRDAGTKADRARISRALNSLGDDKVIRKGTIANIQKTYPTLARKFAEINDLPPSLEKTAQLDELREVAKNAVSLQAGPGEFVIPGRAGQGPPPGLNRFFFADEAQANRAAQSLGTTDPTLFGSETLASISEGAAQFGDVQRVLRTGFDMGFSLIQGLPSLGRAAGEIPHNPKRAAQLFKNWGKSVQVGFKALFSEDVLRQTIADNFDVVSEGVTHGLQLSRASTDIFLGTRTGLGNVPVVGAGAQRVLQSAARPFERAFVAPADYLRIKGYEALRPTAIKNGDQGLNDLAASLNKMTGGLSSDELGIGRSQQALERGWLFFSPRYTRSSLALVQDVFQRGVTGEQARRSLFGVAGLGIGTYVATAEALGQEIELDPTTSRFMTIEIGGDRIGVGSFWTSFARMIVNTGAQLDEEPGDFLDVRDNPIARWIRGRSAPAGSLPWDIGMGEDFLGEPLEGPVDYARHIGENSMPIWAEAGILGDPVRTGIAATGVELVGGRARPETLSEQRFSLRNDLAQARFGRDWEELNRLEREQIQNDDKNADLRELSDSVRALRSRRGDDRDSLIERWFTSRDDIDSDWQTDVVEGISFLNQGIIDPARFKDVYLQPANAERRARLERVNEREGEFAAVFEYFEEIADFAGPERPEDVAYFEYISEIVASDAFDDPEGFDFDRQQQQINEFRLRWGDEVLAYVQATFAAGRDQPQVVGEYYTGLDNFEWYWRQTEAQVVDSAQNSEVLKVQLQRWRNEGTAEGRRRLEEENPSLKGALSQMSRVRQILRQRSPDLDAFLFRWGFTDTLRSRRNQFDGARDFFRSNTTFDGRSYRPQLSPAEETALAG